MRAIRQAKDLGAERTLALASAIADDFARAGWELEDYRWLKFDLRSTSAIDLAFISVDPDAKEPSGRSGSGRELENPTLAPILLTLVLPLVALAAFALFAFLLTR